MQLLIFDLGNVVCRIDFQRVLRAWARGDESELARIAPLFTHDEAYERHERGEVSIEAYKDHVCARLGLSLSLEEFVQGWNAVFVGEMEGIRDVLASYRGRVPLVILSNTNATHAAWFRPRLADLLAPFDRLFLSHEVGMRKPEARFFEHVLAECGVTADQALFFDDLADNLRGAEAVGIPSVLVRGIDDVRAALDLPEIVPFDEAVHSVDEITELLHRAYAPLAAQGMNFWATYQGPEVTRERLLNGQGFVAVQKGTVVGTITYHPVCTSNDCEWYQRPEVGRFGQFAVDPSLQKAGLGTRLIARVLEAARHDGKSELALDTSERATHLIASYTRRGFRHVQTMQWHGVNYRSLVMSKALHPEIETLDSTVVYENRWMTVREDRIRRRNGAEGLYGVVEKPDFAILLPLLGDSIVLVEQYRYTVGQRCWELPAGAYEDAVLDKETLALKELQEETGYSASELVPVGELFTANGYSTQRCHVFIAKGLRPGTPSLEEEEQGLVAKAFPLAEFERMVTSGQIRDAATVSAFGLARLKGLL